MTDTPGGLMGFLERMDKDHDDSLNTWAPEGSTWLKDLTVELFKDWHPLYCIYKGQHLRRKDKDSPWEPYEPEEP